MIEKLKKYVLENNLHNKATEYFWRAFNNWKEEESEKYLETFKDIPMDDLKVSIHCIGLRSSQWPDCDYNHVTVSMYIYHKNDQLGNYVVWYPLSDDIDGDDFLEIY